MEKLPPAGFIAAPRDSLGFAAWLGPADGRVTSTWTTTEGILVHLQDMEALSRAEAEELEAQLHSVLEQLRNHQDPFLT